MGAKPSSKVPHARMLAQLLVVALILASCASAIPCNCTLYANCDVVYCTNLRIDNAVRLCAFSLFFPV